MKCDILGLKYPRILIILQKCEELGDVIEYSARDSLNKDGDIDKYGYELLPSVLAGMCWLLREERRVDDAFIDAVYHEFERRYGNDFACRSNACYNLITSEVCSPITRYNGKTTIENIRHYINKSLSSKLKSLIGDDGWHESTDKYVIQLIDDAFSDAIDIVKNIWNEPRRFLRDEESFQDRRNRLHLPKIPYLDETKRAWYIRGLKFIEKHFLEGLYIGLPAIGVIGLIVYFLYGYWLRTGIEDACMSYLHGRVYCGICTRYHKADIIRAEHVWQKGGRENGWEAIVFVKEHYEPFKFDIKLESIRRVSSMRLCR